VFLDGTIVNVALPAIRSSLNGSLADQQSWRWIFLINPIPVAITVMLLRRLPPDRRAPGRVDWVGGPHRVLGLGGTVFGPIEHSVYGWRDPRVFVALIAGVGAVVSTSFAAQLDDNFAHRALNPQVRYALTTARTRPLVTAAIGVPSTERPAVHQALVDASVHAFRIGIRIAGLLAILGGAVAPVGIENPRRRAPVALQTGPPG
jgi:hypothetical protein